jgi:DNA-binding GntR family transcriptional regulator
LYDRILRGKLAPGGPIRLDDAAAALGVSVTPVREALIELEVNGIVEMSLGRGFRVTPLAVAEVTDVYPLIWTLECFALKQAPHLGPKRLQALEEINGRLVAQSADPVKAVELDEAWHDALLQDSGNALALEQLRMLKRRVRRYEVRFMSATGTRPSADQHETIIQALREGRREDALTALERNWRTGPELLVPWLEMEGG